MTHALAWLCGREVELVLPGKTRRFRSRILDLHVRREDGLLLGVSLRKRHGVRTVYVDSLEVKGRLLRIDMSTDRHEDMQRLRGLRVQTVSGIFLGTVQNVSIDLLSKKLVQIRVWRRYWGIPIRRFVIHRQDIVEMKRNMLVVRDASVPLPRAWFTYVPHKAGATLQPVPYSPEGAFPRAYSPADTLG